MPFGLKNEEATNQWLMDRIFRNIIGHNVEAYVDDMVVKSTIAKEHCDKHQLKLKLKKCSFGVHARKLIGFMLTERGIEANPKKCQISIDMRSPQSVKEVQQLVGRITGLSHFLSRLAETALPIFHGLKKSEKFMDHRE
ncbi:Retrovirus-related Pol polyprotein, partial [Mucuna pruriens]